MGLDRSFFFPCAPGEVVSVDGSTEAMTLSFQAAWFGAVSTGRPDPYRDLAGFARQVACVRISIATAR